MNLPERHRSSPHPKNALQTSHGELRAALMLASKRIVKLNFGKRDDWLLVILRRVLRDARVVADSAAREGCNRAGAREARWYGAGSGAR